MNKKTALKIKNIINYDASIPEHRRLLRTLKKQYTSLPALEKDRLLIDLENLFKNG